MSSSCSLRGVSSLTKPRSYSIGLTLSSPSSISLSSIRSFRPFSSSSTRLSPSSASASSPLAISIDLPDVTLPKWYTTKHAILPALRDWSSSSAFTSMLASITSTSRFNIEEIKKENRILIRENGSVIAEAVRSVGTGEQPYVLTLFKPPPSDLVNNVASGAKWGHFDVKGKGTYTGYIANNFPHGYGVMARNDGSSWEGEWQNGRLQDFGVITWADGQQYIGCLVNGSCHGLGRLSLGRDQRIVYHGYWKEGLRHGRGIGYFEDNSRYEGEWALGEMNGAGRLVQSDGSVCEGVWGGGIMGGRGSLLFPNGEKYVGEMTRGDQLLPHGEGTLYDADGQISYKGHWVDGLQDGLGRGVLETGGIYEGMWAQGIMAGKGRITMPVASSSSSSSSHFSPSSSSSHTSSSSSHTLSSPSLPSSVYSSVPAAELGSQPHHYQVSGESIFDGTWEDGIMVGHAHIVFASGETYTGEVNNALFHGKGRLSNKSGSVLYDGEWEEGLQHGRGQGMLEDGRYYTGEWVKGQPNNLTQGNIATSFTTTE
eukprot:TRINITY_DN5052_c0_g1_i1.p1 TRINITY_DN5052_c0_g1~~TRINITY_DN5052_c0_g1_i1.p1  ORF type:complete len:589 (+),score=129.00 TRINITY_DN5052_c0_g1_i1:149-1768(+)